MPLLIEGKENEDEGLPTPAAPAGNKDWLDTDTVYYHEMFQDKLKCPTCGYPQYCGCCDYCLSKIPPGIKPYTTYPDGYSCPQCGFKGSCDWWLDEGTRQLDERLQSVYQGRVDRPLEYPR